MSPLTDSGLEAHPGAVAVQRDALVAITTDIWSCFLGEEVHPLPEGVAGPHDESVLASVGIVGAWGGHVVLELPVAGAEKAAKRMLGIGEVTGLEIVDALGELGNMVGGNVKSLLPTPCDLGLPIVVRGAVAPAPGNDTVEICRAFLGWADSTVRVSVWADTNHDRNG
ncbi:MAG: chemotaxis protein CheX [Actinomycetota bacterium]|nr:chemotaxis protein CheX [Actinomycetota bacterium]